MGISRWNAAHPSQLTLSWVYCTAATAEALQKPDMESQWVGENILFRLSTVDEFRAPVLFMVGHGGSFKTGADLRVDG